VNKSPSSVAFPTTIVSRQNLDPTEKPRTAAKRDKSSRFATQTLAPKGTIRCTKEVRGRIVRSITVRGVDNFNIVNVEFMDGTAFTVELFPVVQLKAEFNDWTVADGKLLKTWPLITTR
jgi:hypothetical protein